jgi:hypothetical protein
MEDRWASFNAYQLSWPSMDRYFAVGLMQWVALLLLAVAVLWVMNEVFRRYLSAVSGTGPKTTDPEVM